MGKGPWRGLSGWFGRLLEQQFPRPAIPWLLLEQGWGRERPRCARRGQGKVPAVGAACWWLAPEAGVAVGRAAGAATHAGAGMWVLTLTLGTAAGPNP